MPGFAMSACWYCTIIVPPLRTHASSSGMRAAIAGCASKARGPTTITVYRESERPVMVFARTGSTCAPSCASIGATLSASPVM